MNLKLFVKNKQKTGTNKEVEIIFCLQIVKSAGSIFFFHYQNAIIAY